MYRRTGQVQISQLVRQGCSLPPTLFITNLGDMIIKRKAVDVTAIRLYPCNVCFILRTSLLEDEVTIQKNEDYLLQRTYSLFYTNLVKNCYDSKTLIS